MGTERRALPGGGGLLASQITTWTVESELRPMEFRLVPNHFSDLEDLQLADFPVTLGRGTEAGIRVRDRWVSRRHCELDVIDGQLIIRDLGARHGTYVNGEPVAEERLGPGDEIRIGLTTLKLVS